MQGKKKALGRGLSALLEGSSSELAGEELPTTPASHTVSAIPLNQLETNPFQPRSNFEEKELAELAVSIQEQGIIQPVTVRKIGTERFQLISGERRCRAARIAGLTEIPAYIRLANDEQMLEMSIVENIQRMDLNPLEVALSFQRLIEECRIRQEDLGQKVGKDRSTVSNYIRLLKLPVEIQVAVRDGIISMGHARTLITMEDEKQQLQVLQKILEKKLSVRQVEDLVRSLLKPAKPTIPAGPKLLPSQYQHAREKISNSLQSEVEITLGARGKGSILIHFNSEEEFHKLLSKMNPE
ncbi:MAG: ParB/RepB/Spo0J family partition protein [Bacteroidota bacterium]|jgi:ParB family transcriptional regulator, chromosome partitioning protein